VVLFTSFGLNLDQEVALTVVDNCSRENLAIFAAHSIKADDIVSVMKYLQACMVLRNEYKLMVEVNLSRKY